MVHDHVGAHGQLNDGDSALLLAGRVRLGVLKVQIHEIVNSEPSLVHVQGFLQHLFLVGVNHVDLGPAMGKVICPMSVGFSIIGGKLVAEGKMELRRKTEKIGRASCRERVLRLV